MKIAVPTRNGYVDDHFGHAENYSVYTIAPNNQILSTEILTTEQGCGCRSGIAEVLSEKGVTIMLAGNIGAGAIHHLYTSGIDVVRGCSGPADQVILSYLKGEVTDNNQTCHQHEGCDHPS